MPPVEPVIDRTQSEYVQKWLDSYKPNFIHRLFGLRKLVVKLNTNKIQKLRKNEEIQLDLAMEEYQKKLVEYENQKEIARGILENNEDSFSEVIDSYFNKSDLEFQNVIVNKNGIISYFKAPDLNIIPSEEKRVGKSGKLISKEITTSKKVQIYRDFVSANTFLMAKQFFLMFPIDKCVINIRKMELNNSTGYLEEKCISSVQFIRETFEGLNIQNIVPFEALNNFKKNVDYSDKNGFRPVEELML
ncbi:MAG TPA: hypothetical protein PKV16_08920 [Caldisericia bacterium]|nr:hypothetical protein [Caldisericia bacterium]HPF49565.1 hypothetical protein [Caldisericia bacterium]HPI84519.1 hypothetical protein [Caldisericia bacterium]HPQ93885.1 hypothetical protein [Caldisericia bacterium]HRV75430.1 hypothetical protein [Caldisericia bacterium]